MGTSLTTIRQFVGQEMGPYYSGTVNGSGNTTTALAIDALKSSLSISNLFTDWWFVIPSNSSDDRVARRVSSYSPTSTPATLTVDRAYSGTSAVNSKDFEIHGIIEPITELGRCINDTLKRVMVVAEFTVTPTANAIRHDVTTANTWLVNPKWVRQVGYLVTGETRATVDPYRNRTVRGFASMESGLVYLNHPNRTFASNETIYVRCLKPAYAHCRASSSGAYGDTSGLTAEAHETELEAETVAYGAINAAMRRGLVLVSKESNPDLVEKLKESAAQFSKRVREIDQANAELLHLTFRPNWPWFGPARWP